MSTFYVMRGEQALSSARLGRLLETLQSHKLPVSGMQAVSEYYILAEQPLDAPTLNKLSTLLNASPESSAPDKKGELNLRVLPRVGTISPWSSKATHIARNCGLQSVLRIERGFHYVLTLERGLTGFRTLDDPQRDALHRLLHDRMTQSVLNEAASAAYFDAPIHPDPVKTIPVLEEGLASLQQANQALGLALSEPEIQYLLDNFKRVNRNPTDVELMMFAQANSEHCRHKIFNADWIIDGRSKPSTLFGMIRSTHEAQPEHTIVAYADNAAVMAGQISKRFFAAPAAESAGSSFRFAASERLTHTLMKVETHNHPTAISPFPGAATGVGGEIRDEGATGRGAKPKAGLAGFTVSRLAFENSAPALPQTTEGSSNALASVGQQLPDHPERLAAPLDIMIDGPLGAAAYNNEFGRPNLGGYFRVFEQEVAGVHWGYHKPIMIAGGMGSIDDSLTHKDTIPEGALLIQLGGPGMRIGMGGGAASSMMVGANTEDLDFDSVQRDNAELERRAQEVIDRCWQLYQDNPIIAIHDVGAGGLSNAFPELINDAGKGGVFDLRRVQVEEAGMSAAEIWSNESQERYVLAIMPEHLERFDRICRRERCPYAVIGQATAERSLKVVEGEGLPSEPDSTSLQEGQQRRPVDLPLDVILGKVPKMQREAQSHHYLVPAIDVVGHDISDLAWQVMRHPTVANKTFLITIGDRSVGGLNARDQMVGPWQIPVADCAVTLADFESLHGEAMAMGERTPLAIINAPASGRMAVTEAVTNLLASDVEQLQKIKLSANWMAACGFQGQDAALYDTVEAVSDFCRGLGISIPVGKDSLSMQSHWQDDQGAHQVVSPVSLIVSAFAAVGSTEHTLTPQLRTDRGDSCLILIDLSKGQQRLAGSVLSAVLDDYGHETPDFNEPQILQALFDALRTLRSKDLIWAYHDRSDGGLFATIAEMAFAGHTGVTINVDMLTFDARSTDWGDYKIKPEQVSVQRSENAIKALFNEEAGVVIQVSRARRDEVMQILRAHGLSQQSHVVGSLNSEDQIQIYQDGRSIASFERSELGKAWSEVSYRIMHERDNPATAKAEYQLWDQKSDPGLSPRVRYNPQENLSAPYISRGQRPAVAILREQGCNSQVEMAWAFTQAGFDAYDVHMTDLLEARIDLAAMQGLVAVGGFSYGDVLGAGQGWARTILFNDTLTEHFEQFFNRPETFALGVCNGCQMLSSLGSIMPGTAHWPLFTANVSGRHEARLSLVEIPESPSIFFRGMAGSRIPVAVSHGEGYANFEAQGSLQDAKVAMRYINNQGAVTEMYPANPNGSPQGIAGLTTEDGRFTIMMPHPERVTRNAMLSWKPERWSEQDQGGDYSPWMRMFMNARVFVD